MKAHGLHARDNSSRNWSGGSGPHAEDERQEHNRNSRSVIRKHSGANWRKLPLS